MIALSRVRLGAYLFGSLSLMEQSVAWSPLVTCFQQYPTKLTLLAGESYPTQRLQSQSLHSDQSQGNRPANVLEIEEVSIMGMLVYQMTQQMMQH